MKQIARATFLSAALLTTALVPLTAQQIVGARDARALRVDSVFQAFDRTDSPGCAVGVFRDDSLVYARGYGMASLELGVAITPRTVFEIGSISKEFTAMSILLLAREGKLSIDDPVRKYIPELPAYADQITLRQLLSHTSGIRDHFGLMELAGFNFEGTADTVDYLHYITRSAAPNFEPGTQYLYSNSGFVLLAQIVYRVSGQTLAQYAAQHIFAPLGMTDTRFQDDHALVIPNHAEGYTPRGRGFAMRMSQWDGMAGAAGIQTSIEDFGRWLRNFDEGTVGGRAIVDAMQTASHYKNDSLVVTGPNGSYGLGLTVGTYRGLRVIGHSGVWAGYRAEFMRFPEQKLAAATFCNFTTAGPDTLIRKVAAVYLENQMAADNAATWRATLAGAPRATESAAEAQKLSGVWRNVERGEVRRTVASGDTLFFDGGRRTALQPLGDRRFLNQPATEVRFERDSAGAPSRLVVRTANGATTTYVRAAAATLTAAQLAEYAGSYYSPELETTQVLRVERDSLVVTRGGRRVGVLRPMYRDGFVDGGNEIDFTRDGKGRITGFVIEAGRVRHLHFDRVR